MPLRTTSVEGTPITSHLEMRKQRCKDVRCHLKLLVNCCTSIRSALGTMVGLETHRGSELTRQVDVGLLMGNKVTLPTLSLNQATPELCFYGGDSGLCLRSSCSATSFLSPNSLWFPWREKDSGRDSSPRHWVKLVLW